MWAGEGAWKRPLVSPDPTPELSQCLFSRSSSHWARSPDCCLCCPPEPSSTPPTVQLRLGLRGLHTTTDSEFAPTAAVAPASERTILRPAATPTERPVGACTVSLLHAHFLATGCPLYWCKPPSTPRPQHRSHIPTSLLLFCRAIEGGRRVRGSGWMVTLSEVPGNKGLRPNCLHLTLGTCMHQCQGSSGISLSPMVPCLCPNMPSACDHRALDDACPGCPHLHCTVPIEPPLDPLRDRAAERGRRLGLPYDQRRPGKKPSLLP